MIITKEKVVSVNTDGTTQTSMSPTPCMLFINDVPISKIENNSKDIYSTYNIENPLVREYVNDTTYVDGYGRGDGISILKSTLAIDLVSNRPCWVEHPNPYPLCTSGTAKFRISETSDFSKYKEYTSNKRLTLIYNLIPNKNYYCRTFDSNGKLIKEFLIQQTGKVRMLYIKNLQNVRDIGGWECYDKSGKKIGHLAYGKILRGSGRNKDYGTDYTIDLKESLVFDANVKCEMNVASVTDLRIFSNVDCSTYGVTYTSIGSMSDYDNIFTNLPDATIYYITQLAKNLQNNICTYIHCSQGADRTGTLCAIIEALCGCHDDAIIKDWELTSYMRILSSRKIDEITKTNSKLRLWFRTLYNTYYDATSRPTMQQQIEYWLVNDLKISQSVIDTIKSQMIVLD